VLFEKQAKLTLFLLRQAFYLGVCGFLSLNIYYWVVRTHDLSTLIYQRASPVADILRPCRAFL